MNKMFDAMEQYEEIKEELRKIITPQSKFVCIGTNSVMFDMFGPLCGDHLKNKQVPYYGDSISNVNGVNMLERLNQIYNVDKIDNEDIIAIDAALTKYEYKLNKLQITDEVGIQPGAGVGRRFPMVGNKSIKMFTLMEKDVNKVIRGYKSCKGITTDTSDIRKISISARILCDLIKEVYNEVCLIEA